MKRRGIALGAAALVAVLFPAGCGRGRISVTMAGSTAFQPFAEVLAEQYMDAHPDVTVTVQGGGSAVGIQSAISGAAQIGMADLVDLPPEAANLKAVVVAKDAIAVVVNPANPINDLTTEQVRAIFSGQVLNWKDVGGPDSPITVVSREAGSGTRSSFEQIVQDVKLTSDAIIQDSNGTIRETVANDGNAIGYLSHGLLNDKIKALSVDNVSSDEEQIAKGAYKLVRPVFFLTNGLVEEHVQGFIDYVLSPEGQATIKASGLLPAQ